MNNRLAKINIKPRQVSKVRLTHLHESHIDGLKFFPTNEVIVNKLEYKHPYGNLPITYPTSFNDIEHILFAGDTSYKQEQLLDNTYAWSNIDYTETQETYNSIKKNAKNTQLYIYPHTMKILGKDY